MRLLISKIVHSCCCFLMVCHTLIALFPEDVIHELDFWHIAL
jgi:hypothetical protein